MQRVLSFSCTGVLKLANPSFLIHWPWTAFGGREFFIATRQLEGSRVVNLQTQFGRTSWYWQSTHVPRHPERAPHATFSGVFEQS